MKLVVDASVAVKWFVRTAAEPNLAEAEAVAAVIESSSTDLFAPAHWIAEVVAVIARVDSAQVSDAILYLDDMRPRRIDGIRVLRRAADLAVSLDHHLFDTLYHAVALETGATLVTADDRYFAKAQGQGSVVLLEDFRAAP